MTPPVPEAWQTQIVLCYEQEPYVAFDVTPALLEAAIAAENPPIDNAKTTRAWVIASLNHLREEVALIRDHSDELMLEPGRRGLLIHKAILMVEYLLADQQQSLSSVGAVIFNLLASQSPVEANAPGFQIMGLDKPFSVAEIRAMSTAERLYQIEIDNTVAEVEVQQSKDRSTKRACMSIQAFWRNKRPGGIMLEMKANVEQGQFSLDTEMELLDRLVLELARTRPSAADCNRYLRQMAQQRPENDYEASFQIMATIAYAEEAGHLHSDEYNGMVYIYRVDEHGFFIDRKDRPTH